MLNLECYSLLTSPKKVIAFLFFFDVALYSSFPCCFGYRMFFFFVSTRQMDYILVYHPPTINYCQMVSRILLFRSDNCHSFSSLRIQSSERDVNSIGMFSQKLQPTSVSGSVRDHPLTPMRCCWRTRKWRLTMRCRNSVVRILKDRKKTRVALWWESTSFWAQKWIDRALASPFPTTSRQRREWPWCVETKSRSSPWCSSKWHRKLKHLRVI